MLKTSALRNHKIGLLVFGLFSTFGLLQRKHFNFAPGSILFSSKSHANTVRAPGRTLLESKHSWNQTQGLSLMTQTVPQAQHNLAHRTATIALPQHIHAACAQNIKHTFITSKFGSPVCSCTISGATRPLWHVWASPSAVNKSYYTVHRVNHHSINKRHVLDKPCSWEQ